MLVSMHYEYAQYEHAYEQFTFASNSHASFKCALE